MWVVESYLQAYTLHEMCVISINVWLPRRMIRYRLLYVGQSLWYLICVNEVQMS